MNDHHLVSATTASHHLDITKGCLYRMARAGIIPRYRVGVKGRGVRFDVEEVKNILRRDIDEKDEG